MSLHENGPWTVENGLFVNAYGACTNNPAVCFDISNGCVFKCCDTEIVQNYMAKAIDAYKRAGFTEMAQNITVITFDRYGFLNADSICTLMNYMQNSIDYEKMQKLLAMKEKELNNEIQRLQELGF